MNRQSVTFALVAYNHERYIREAVEAVLAQACEPMEVILSDDASTDQTFEIIREVVADYKGPHTIKVNRNSQNLGLAAHVNKIFGMASGSIVALAAGDDISLPSRISDTVAAFQKHPSITMVSFTDDIIDEAGNIILVRAKSDLETVFDLSEFLARGPLAQRQLQMSGASRAILKSTFQTFGDLLQECPAEDTPLILRSLYVGQGLVCHWPGIRYRQHDRQLSTEGSIARMDSAIFAQQYLLDLAAAQRVALLDDRLACRVKRWIDESDLFFRIRRAEFARDQPTLRTVCQSLGSSYMAPREKAGVLKRFLTRGGAGARLRRGKAHVEDLFGSPLEYLRHVVLSRPRTDIARWSLDSNFDTAWEARTNLIARHLRRGDRIAEFGAGMQALRKLLPDGCAYQPYDLVARTVGTRVCDLNVEFPQVGGGSDVAVFSGVLEYLHNLSSTFQWLSDNFERVIFSYAVSDLMPSPLVRNRHGWINNLSRQELVDLARTQGYSCRVVDSWKNHIIFVAEKQ
jgi:glycosyltransferase involved in cell wall biosynthesis